MGNIYWIRTRTGLYVGKWTDRSKDHMQYHLDRAAVYNVDTTITEAWEAAWHQDILNYGFRDDSFIKRTFTEDENAIKQRIISSFNNALKLYPETTTTGTELFNSLCSMWGTNELAVSEALCILLAAKDNSDLLNLQIDFLTRKDLHNIDNFFNVGEFKRRQEAVRKKWMPWIFFTFETKGQSFSDIDETLAKDMGLKGRINVLKHPKVVKFLLNEIDVTTKRSIKRQLEAYIKELKNSRNCDENSPLVQYIRKLMSRIDHWRGKSRDSLIKMIKEAVTNDQWNQLFSDTYDLETDEDKIKAAVDVLKYWYNTTSCEEILNFSGDYDWKDKAQSYYKKKFTQFIQTICFNEGINYEYQDWKLYYATSREGFEQSDDNFEKEGLRFISSNQELYMSPGRFYPVWCRLRQWEQPDKSLSMKTYEKISKLGTFITTNWTSGIYNEQVAYFLTQNDVAFNFTNVTNGFINTISSTDEIKWY